MKHPLLSEILSSQVVHDAAGRSHPLKSGITPDEGEFIWNIITSQAIERTLEIGCGYGISTLYICDALSSKTLPQHLIIDPNQSTEYCGIGTRNLDQANFDFYQLIEKPSEIALPELLLNGTEPFDFALVDGYHTFDQVILEFYYIDMLLKENGIIVFDDVTIFPGVGKAVRYIATCPNYEIYGTVRLPPLWKRRLVDATKRLLGRLLWTLPNSLAREFLNDSILNPHARFGLNTRMIAVKKTALTKRSSGWYVPF